MHTNSVVLAFDIFSLKKKPNIVMCFVLNGSNLMYQWNFIQKKNVK